MFFVMSSINSMSCVSHDLFFSESMLERKKDVMFICMSHDGAYDNMFQDLAIDACQ